MAGNPCLRPGNITATRFSSAFYDVTPHHMDTPHRHASFATRLQIVAANKNAGKHKTAG